MEKAIAQGWGTGPAQATTTMPRLDPPRLTLLLGLFLALAPHATPRPAEDPEHPSCTQTRARVLEPFERRLELAMEAARQYAESVRIDATRLREELATRVRAKQDFVAALTEELEGISGDIAAAEAAIAHGRAQAKERIADLEETLQELREAGRDERATSAALAKVRAELAAGEVRGYSDELKASKLVNAWYGYIGGKRERARTRLAAYAAGEVSVFHPELNGTTDERRIDASIEEWKAKIAFTIERKKAFFVHALNGTLTGESIDANLKRRQEELEEAEAAIAAGTFRLYVPTLRGTTDRSHVLAKIAERRQALAQIRADWGAGSYLKYNPKARGTTTNGAFEEDKARAQEELAAFLAKGDEAVAHNGRGMITGRQLKQALAEAQANGQTELAARLAESLAGWELGHANIVQELRERMAWRDEQLEAHRVEFEKDVAAREEDLEGHYAWALGETPCGGGSSAIVDRLDEFVGRNSETDEEGRCRQERYRDHVFVRADGVVLGDPRQGLYAAHADLPIGPAGRYLGERQLEVNEHVLAEAALAKLKQSVTALQDWKDTAEFAAHSHNLGKFIYVQERLGSFHRRLSDVPQTAKALAREGPKIAEEFADLPKLLEEAVHNRLAITQAIGDLSRKAIGPEAQALRESLKAAAAGFEDLRNLEWYQSVGKTLNLFRTLQLPADAGFWTNKRGATNQIFQSTADEVKQSRLAQVMLVAALLKGAADTQDRMLQGQEFSEALGRSTADFMVDLVVAELPPLAAAEMIFAVGLNVAAYTTGADSLKMDTPSEMGKWATEEALNAAASAARRAGERGAVKAKEILEQGLDEGQVRAALADVERRLGEVEPGSQEAARLMQMRGTFRGYLRAREGTCDTLEEEA